MLHWHFSSGKVVLLSLLKEAKPSPDRQKMIKLLTFDNNVSATTIFSQK